MSRIEMDERFGGSYQFVRKDELVVSARDIKISIFGKIATGIMSLIVGLGLSVAYVSWEKYEAIELRKKREAVEQVLNFHAETSRLYAALSRIQTKTEHEETISILAEMISEANRFKQYYMRSRYLLDSEFPGFPKYPSFDTYQEALSQALVFVHSGEGNLENILIKLIEGREAFLREYSRF